VLASLERIGWRDRHEIPSLPNLVPKLRNGTGAFATRLFCGKRRKCARLLARPPVPAIPESLGSPVRPAGSRDAEGGFRCPVRLTGVSHIQIGRTQHFDFTGETGNDALPTDRGSC
jgi:hypothetical protein